MGAEGKLEIAQVLVLRRTTMVPVSSDSSKYRSEGAWRRPMRHASHLFTPIPLPRITSLVTGSLTATTEPDSARLSGLRGSLSSTGIAPRSARSYRPSWVRPIRLLDKHWVIRHALTG